ncbi:OmpA family protein [Methylomicrobium album]|uniref:Outer membrane protein/peptidoglycan-associated (Lipo)protein n=1 Tax=Methylomicrobium album BG8 TaxID=686340 RepID=H8GJT9_METAL|nr:OmpA family protein [Methylomicrobium album]EIC31618.1 outer membrane protein/peptidoglycan-associated (lipo)protein [Methylomicrobium album BG8]
MEYLRMRRAITAASITMLGASAVIFMAVLFVSRQRAISFPAGGRETEARRESLTAVDTSLEIPAPEQKRSLGMIHKPALSEKTREGGTAQNGNASARKPAEQPDTSVPLLSAVVTEATAPRIPEKPSNPASPKKAEEEGLSRDGEMRLLVLGEGAFSPGVAKPGAGAQAEIDKIIPLIQERSSDKVIIEGHADRSIPGGFTRTQAWKWNKIVSMLRAKAVAQALKQKGVAGDRIIVKGLGDSVPRASNLTRKGRSKNRRVEITLSPPGAGAGH